MTRRIVLHIGSPKCGSTYLQRVLLQNRPLLERHGFRYPHSGAGHPGNVRDLRNITEDRLQEMFGPDAHTLLLSHEDLYPNALWADGLSAIVHKAAIPVQLVAFLRPFSEFVFGDYSQYMKQYFEPFLASRNPYEGRTFQGFARFRVETLNPALFLLNWQSRFPELPLIVESHRNIRPVYETLLGSGIDLNWAVDVGLTNPSLRMEDCDRLAAAMRDPALPEAEIRAMFRTALGDTAKPDAGRSAARKMWLETQFIQRNRGLMKYFGHDNRLAGYPPDELG